MRPLRFSVGDLYLLVLLFDYLFAGHLSSLPSQPFSRNFALHGIYVSHLDFPSMSLLSNSGPFFLVLSLELLFLFSFCLLSLKCFVRHPCWRRVRSFCTGARWDSFIRLFLEAMLELVLFSLLNIYEVLGIQVSIPNLTVTSYISLTLSCLCLAALCLFFFSIFRVMASTPK